MGSFIKTSNLLHSTNGETNKQPSGNWVSTKKPQLPNEFFIKTSNLPELTKTHGKNKGVGNKQTNGN